MTVTKTVTNRISSEETSALLHNGTIHSVAEPYAEAMMVEDATVAWLGADDTAEHLRSDRVVSQDLDRALVAPAFVGAVTLPLREAADPGVLGNALDRAAQQGYATVRLWIRVTVEDLRESVRPALVQELRHALSVGHEHPINTYPVVALTGLEADGGAPSISDVNVLLDVLETLEPAGTAEGNPLAAALNCAEILPNLLGVRSWCGEAGRQLLLECEGVDAAEAAEAMAVTQRHLRDLGQTPSSDAPTVLVGFDSARQGDWETLLNTGAHVLLRHPGHLSTALKVGVPTAAAPAEGENPWQMIADHVHHHSDPVSVRAGFNAQTRGAHRSLVGAAASAGQLVPGAAATFAVWEVDSLAVQTPHSTVSAWSTDTRARTPLLPYLDGTSLPRLISTVIQGVKR